MGRLGIVHCSKGIYMLNEVNMTRGINFVGDRFKTIVCTLFWRVSNKDTRFGFRVKFVRSVWFKPRVA